MVRRKPCYKNKPLLKNAGMVLALVAGLVALACEANQEGAVNGRVLAGDGRLQAKKTESLPETKDSFITATSDGTTVLKGFTQAPELESKASLAFENLAQPSLENKAVFAFVQPAGFVSSYSNPVLETNSASGVSSNTTSNSPSAISTVVRNSALPATDGAAMVIEGEVTGVVSYSANPPTIGALLNLTKASGQCGDIGVNFYIKLTSEANNTMIYTLRPPPLAVKVPCPEDSFANLAMQVGEAGTSAVNTSTVDLTITATALVKEMYMTNTPGCASGGSWEPFAKQKLGWTLPVSGGVNTVYVQTKDIVGHLSQCVSMNVTHDASPPTNPTLAINSNAATTTSDQVTLSLNASDATGLEMYVTNTSGCASGGVWEAFATSKSWKIDTSTNPTYTFVRFRDAAGNTSPCVSNAITYVAPTTSGGPTATSINIDSGATTTSSTNVTLTLAATGATQMYATNTVGCTSGGAWEVFATSKAWTLAQTNATASVYIKFKDSLGNESSCIHDTIDHSTAPPSATSLSINAGATYTNATGVSLTLAATGASAMYITNTAACSAGGSWESFATTKAWTLAQTNATATVYVKFKNAIDLESSCINATIIHNNQTPTATSISINAAASVTTSTSVSLTLGASDASHMYVSDVAGCASGGSWESYATTKAWTLAQTNTTATVYVKFKNIAGNESSCINDTITHDSQAPTSPSISINAGAAYATTTSATLTLAATGASDMYVTDTSGCASGGSWESYTTTKSWTLAQTNAVATVYVKYKDAVGNETSCINDTITHDNQPPTSDSISINAGAAYTVSTSATLTLAATGASDMYVTDSSGCASGGSWESYATSRAWTLAQTNATATVYIKYKDAAGNESSCINDTITHDNQAPSATSISIDAGASYATSTSVSLTLGATGASDMYVTNTSGCAADGSWESYATSKSWTLGQTNATATVYIKYKDAAGNETSCINDTITHDNQAPASTSLSIDAGATHAASTAVNLTLAATGASQMYVTNTSGCAADGSWEAYGTSKAWTLGQTNGTATVYVIYKDDAGNQSSCINDTITHDGQAPSSISVDINSNATYANTTSVTLTLAASDALAIEMYVTNTAGCGADGSWENFAASKSWTLGQTNATATVYAKFKDSLGNTSSCVSDTITHDDQAPTATSISINSGGASTSNASGLLTLAATDATQMYITNTSGCGSGGYWVSYATSTYWNMGQTNATATVYAKFRDAALNETSCINDTITHSGTVYGITKPMLAVNENHACALGADGGVRCWGSGSWGALGNNQSSNLTTPASSNINFGTGLSAVKITNGYNHNCAILNNGSVKCWGRNNYGQLGQDNVTTYGDGAGTSVASLSPVNLGANKTALEVSAGFYHSCALLNDGTVKCWGRNNYGQLGRDSTTNAGDGTGTAMASLTPINLGANKTAIQISAGAYHTCALLNDFQVKCWGYNATGQLGTGNTTNVGDGVGTAMASLNAINVASNKSVLQVAAGYSATCAILNDRSVKCWQGATAVSSQAIISLGTNATAKNISASQGHYCAVLNDGSAKCWGTISSSGQLGQDSTANIAASAVASTPAINLGPGKTAIQVQSGYYQTCALLNDGTVKCWGHDGGLGLLGHGTVFTVAGNGVNKAMADLPPIPLGTSRLPIQIAAGGFHTCAILATGNAKCWGHNLDGQLGLDSTTHAGDGTGTAMASLSDINLGTDKTALQLAAGYKFTCALLNDGNVKCWGRANLGQLGRNSTTIAGDGLGTAMSSLSAINLGTNKTAVQIDAGDSFVCAVLNDGSVKCWGENNYGQLGQGNTTNAGDGTGTAMASLAAINLGTNKTAVKVTTGSNHACALLNDGTVKCWGYNDSGQLGQDHITNAGDGTGTAVSALAAVNLGTNKTAVDVVAGSYHTCARLNDGTVKCWGRNASGQLGLDSTTNAGNDSGTAMASLTTVNLGSNMTAQALTAGFAHTCALLNDGNMKCWGRADYGQLGQDSTVQHGDSGSNPMASLTAITLGAAGTTAASIAAGHYHSCALLTTGVVKCWGHNDFGQLGSNSTTKAGDGSGTAMSSLSTIPGLQ